MAADAEATAARVTAVAWLDRACISRLMRRVRAVEDWPGRHPNAQDFYFAVAAVLAVLVAFVRELWSRAL